MKEKLKWYERGILNLDRTLVHKLLVQVKQLPEILDADTVLFVESTQYTFKLGSHRNIIIAYLQSLKSCKNANACNMRYNNANNS